MPEKLIIPEKEQLEVKKAVKLLQKAQANKDNVLTMIAVEIKIKALSERIRSLAEAEMRGENRLNMQLGEAAKINWDQSEVAKEWAKTLKKVEERKTKWAEPAREKEEQFRAAVKNYGVAMDPLFKALNTAKTANVPRVEAKANEAISLLTKARNTLPPLLEAANKAVFELDDFLSLMATLEIARPVTLPEVTGAQARMDEAVQKVRNAEEAIQKQVASVNGLCKSMQAEIQKLIRDMVAAAIAWAETEKVRQGTEWFEAVANGSVEAVQALDSEPLSAVAVQGIHMLIKGVSDGIKLSAWGIQTQRTKKTASSKDTDAVIALVDRLDEKEIGSDAFIKMKLDGIQMGISWVAEPLGFIPNAGTLVRTAINGVTKVIIGALKDAAKKQAAALAQKRGVTHEEVQLEIDTIKDTVVGTVQTALENGIKTYKKWDEFVDGAKKLEAAEVALAAAMAVFGPAISAMLSKVIPDLGVTNPDTIKESLRGARDSVADLGAKTKALVEVKLDFAYDEAAAKASSTKALKDLLKGKSAKIMVASSKEFKTTRGVGLLIGDDHTSDNFGMIDSLIREGSGFAGTVTMKDKGGRVTKGELVFEFSDARAKKLVKDYFEHYGTGDNRVSGKSLTFQ